ncbi:phage tail tape measure protein [Haloactinopolyspora sp.]|uniref:phage tail tape measure protein n=1 Tax=Haloactinopolyspora sp. TaxID=1966353 RepID=UPI002631517B|nr:phage tail tape measure protein [Haloactinopolyspora sp.]
MSTLTKTLMVKLVGNTSPLSEQLHKAEGTASKVGGRMSKSFSGLSGVLSNLGVPLGPFGAGLDQLGQHLDGVDKKSHGFASGMAEMGKAITIGGVAAVGAAATESIKLAMSYDKATGQLASNAGITVAAAKRIGSAFLTTGGQTTFSAQQIMGAYAGVAGQLGQTEGHALSATDALTVMKDATDLAEASGTDLTSATSGLSQVMQAYGVSVKGAGAATDVLFNVSRATHQPIAGLTTILGRLHGRLGALAPSLADVGTLMMFPQVASQGSRGAMIVNTGLQTLIGGSKAVTKELGSLGVNIFDASGKFVGMRSVIAQVQPKLAGMTDQQRLLAEQTLFGKSAAQLMGSTVMGGVAAYDAAHAAVTRLGSAHRGAERATDNLAATTEKLKSAAEDLGVKFGEFLEPKLLGAAHAAQKVVNFFEKNKTAAIALGVVVGGVLAAAVGAFAVNTGVKLVRSVADAGKAMGKLGKKAVEMIRKLGLFQAAEEETGAASEAMGKESSMAFGPIGIAIAAIAIIGFEVVKHWKTISKDLGKAFHAIAGVAKTVWHGIQRVFDGFMDFLKSWGPKVGLVLLTVLTGGLGLAVVAFVKWHKQIIGFVEKIPGEIVHGLSSLGHLLGRWATDAWHLGYEAFVTEWHIIKELVWTIPQKIIDGVIGLGDRLYQWASEAWGMVTSALASAWSATWSWITGLPGKILSGLGNLGTMLWNAGTGIVQGLVNGISSAWHLVWDFIKGKMTGLVSGVLGFFGIHSPSTVFAGIGRNLMEGMALGITTGSTSTSSAMAAANARLSGLSGSLTTSALASAGTGALAGGVSPGAAPSAGAPEVNVYAQTNADPHQIAAEVGWALRTML